MEKIQKFKKQNFNILLREHVQKNQEETSEISPMEKINNIRKHNFKLKILIMEVLQKY